MGRLIVAVVIVGFTVYCLIDAARADRQQVRGLPKIAWLLLILLMPVLGGVIWLVAGRPRSGGGGGRDGRPRHAGSPPSPPPRVIGPDDDPDFLRGLDRRARPPGPGPSGPRRKDPGGPVEGEPLEGPDRDAGRDDGQGTDRGAGGTDRR